LFRGGLNVRELVLVVGETVFQYRTDTVLLVGENLVEHVNGAGLKVEGVLQILCVLLLLVGVEGVLDFNELLASLLKLFYKHLHLFLTTHQASNLAHSF
jgi:hypothetical protein